MPRKSIVEDVVVADFVALSHERYERAKNAYELQDAKTKKAIDKMVAVLKENASRTVRVKDGGVYSDVEVADEILEQNFLWLAVEIVSDLLYVGLRVANYKIDPMVCASCGESMVRRRGGR